MYGTEVAGAVVIIRPPTAPTFAVVPWENGTQLNLNPVNFYEQLAGSAISNHLGLPAARATAIDLHINGEHQQSGGKYVFLQPLGSNS